MHNACSSIEKLPYFSVKFQGHTGQKKPTDFDTNSGVSGLALQFELTDGFEMIHKAWSSIEKVSCCFSRSSVKFQGHTGQKAPIWPNSGVPEL